MMTKQIETGVKFRLATIAVTLVVVLASPVLAQNGPRGRGNGPRTGIAAAGEPLTAEETADLLYMREEEKLARDVYQHFFEKWNLVIFANISASEDRHTNAITRKLARYGVADPGMEYPAGVYANEELNQLYATLVAQGDVSVEAALEVGILVEEIDIADLEEALLRTNKLDVKRVYTNLLNGSYNHLEAFRNTHEAVCQATAQ
jgi:hypothetical protein